MEKVFLLTGASGLLGSSLTRALIEKGEHVRALVLPKDPAISHIPPLVEIVNGGILDDEALEKFFNVQNDAEIYVIHAAGIVTMDPLPNKKVYDVNVGGTQKIINWCLKKNVKKLVYISSSSVIPELKNGKIMREIENIDPNITIGYYAKTKAEATNLVLKAVKENDLNASIVYPSGIFGPNDYGFGLITSALKMIASGKLRASIGGSFNSVDVRDLAQGIISCAEKGRKGEGYILSNDCNSLKEVMKIAGKITGNKIIAHFPLWFVYPFAWFGELYAKITRKPVWFSNFALYNLKRNNNYSNEKAKKELGFTTRPIEETIKDTIHWLQSEGLVKQSTKKEKKKKSLKKIKIRVEN